MALEPIRQFAGLGWVNIKKILSSLQKCVIFLTVASNFMHLKMRHYRLKAVQCIYGHGTSTLDTLKPNINIDKIMKSLIILFKVII